MNRKGELTVGAFVVVIIGLLACLAIYQGIGPSIGTLTNTITVTNTTATLPSGVTITALPGQRNITDIFIANRTSGAAVSGFAYTNFTVRNELYNGLIRIVIQNTTGTSAYQGQNVNLSYSYEPEGYISEGGSRAVTLLIPLMAALALLVGLLLPFVQQGLKDLMD